MELRVPRNGAYVVIGVIIILLLFACRQLPPEAKKVEPVSNETPTLPVEQATPSTEQNMTETTPSVPVPSPASSPANKTTKLTPTVVHATNVTQFTQRGNSTRRWLGTGCHDADACPKNYSRTYKIRVPEWLQKDAPK